MVIFYHSIVKMFMDEICENAIIKEQEKTETENKSRKRR